MSNTGCGDKWDGKPKRRAMQNGAAAKDGAAFLCGDRRRCVLFSNKQVNNSLPAEDTQTYVHKFTALLL